MSIRLIARPYEDGFEIVGNRDGLRRLAEVCLSLAQLPEDDAEARKMGNHFHFADYYEITLEYFQVFVRRIHRQARHTVEYQIWEGHLQAKCCQAHRVVGCTS